MMRPTQGDRAAVDCRLPIADCRLEAGVPELGRAASPRQPGRTRLNVRGGLGEPALPAHARYRYAIGFLLVSFLLVFCPPAQALSDTTLAGISFEQKLNTQVSLDLPFRDEAGNPVRLGNYFGHKPVILVLGYYECPMLCSLVLNGMVESLEDLKWSIGNQFEVVNISINPRESPALAAAKKRNYLKRYGRAGAEPGWHFLTGEEPAIQRLADEVGFQYAYDAASRQYAHPSGLIILTPEGKVARYFFGVTFASSEVYAALKAASGNQIGSPIQKLILLCFHYNPITGKYGPTILLMVRLLGVATVLGLGWLIFSALRRERHAAGALASGTPDQTAATGGALAGPESSPPPASKEPKA